MTDPPSLTSRQLDVARLVADGLTTKRIAAQLGIANDTVRGHVQAIAGRLALPSDQNTLTLIARWWWRHAA